MAAAPLGPWELLGFDFEAKDLNRLYRASDALHRAVDAAETAGFEAALQAAGSAEQASRHHRRGQNHEAARTSHAAHPGVYCLRTTSVDWEDSTLWRTDTMLTNLEDH